jgi:hypothetical protein
MYAHAAAALGLEYWNTQEAIPAELFSRELFVPASVFVGAVRTIVHERVCGGAGAGGGEMG